MSLEQIIKSVVTFVLLCKIRFTLEPVFTTFPKAYRVTKKGSHFPRHISVELNQMLWTLAQQLLQLFLET